MGSNDSQTVVFGLHNVGLPLDVSSVQPLDVQVVNAAATVCATSESSSTAFAVYKFLIQFRSNEVAVAQPPHFRGTHFWKQQFGDPLLLPSTALLVKRFSEFATLHSRLEARYPSVPSLPSKTLGHRILSTF